MSIRFFRWTFVVLMLTGLAVMLLSPPQTIGVSASWSTDSYRFAAGTQSWFLILASLIVVAYFASMNGVTPERGLPVPGMAGRFVAFWLDFVIAMMAIAPVFGVVPVLVEWKRTGIFAWTFERSWRSSSDSFLAISGALFSMVGLFFYYVFPLLRRRPSPGGCIVGYQIVCEEGKKLSFEDATMRTLLAMVAIVGCLVTAFVGRDRTRGRLWFDRVFHTQAVKL